jgi:hypothetical protein
MSRFDNDDENNIISFLIIILFVAILVPLILFLLHDYSIYIGILLIVTAISLLIGPILITSNMSSLIFSRYIIFAIIFLVGIVLLLFSLNIIYIKI